MVLYEYQEIDLTPNEFESLPEQIKKLFLTYEEKPIPSTRSILFKKTDYKFETTADFIKKAKSTDEFLGKTWVCFPSVYRPIHVKSVQQTIIEFGDEVK